MVTYRYFNAVQVLSAITEKSVAIVQPNTVDSAGISRYR